MKQSLFLISLMFCVTVAKSQWVATVAGVLETPGFNDGAALSARFFNPHGIAADTLGKIYIADRFNHTIRVFDTNTGLVSTLAGKAGQTGSANGVGENARFNEPWGLCATPAGVVYVADTKNNKIRRVMPDGTVSTLAGTGDFGATNGLALSASFGKPTGIEMDASGNLYVADHLTHVIRKITPAGLVSTLAGFAYIPGDTDGTGTAAQFWRPYGLTLDNQGNIIVADEWNHKIRRVTPQGAVTTIAGNGLPDLADGPAANASFNYPWDVTVDPLGNIYVADGYNYVVRVIGTDGMVTSLAGTPQTSGGVDGEGGNASFSGATAIAWAKHSGTLFVGDAYNHLIREITIGEPPAPTLTLLDLGGGGQRCEGDELFLQANPANYDSYRFFLNGALEQENSTNEFYKTNLPPGTHAIVAEAIFQGQTIVSNTLNITISTLPQPAISVVGELSFYEGDSVLLIASGAGSFLWSNAEATQGITVTQSGTYFVEATENGCTGMSDEVVVEVIPLPDSTRITVLGDTVLCPGETTLLESSSTAGNQWLKDGWLLPGATFPTLEVSEPGIFQLQVTDASTGITSLSNIVEITAAPQSDFDFTATPRTGEPGQEVVFTLTGEVLPRSFDWRFGEGLPGSSLPAPSHRYEAAGLYDVTLTATDLYGCEHTISKPSYIRISETPVATIPGIFIPNAFTPNGDGENDLFRVRGKVEGRFTMLIFNQWGELLFQSENPSQGWDGTRNGLAVHSGTYVYLVNIGEQQLTGHVTLLR